MRLIAAAHRGFCPGHAVALARIGLGGGRNANGMWPPSGGVIAVVQYRPPGPRHAFARMRA
ncbi:hypothetical protein P152DRAFT_338572 [Eremomyces bilateralis CBS 781.70]|uniref:Uncharacterized protein n=1 Tax=Eremomyces bilateralis CBS 781.70 TaxID=1392243 RepID=A0A6G1FQ45_9PEZI|nr:hypothetical protein P152DRAFT_338572 [Eremomyces bilateralis CBS 781.70]